eukprot:scaffold118196_cov17-Tisochrysis_lutea.AAC.1
MARALVDCVVVSVILVKVEACATPAMLCAARKSISGLFHCFPVCVFQLSQGRRAASAAAARSKADSKSKLLLKHKFVGFGSSHEVALLVRQILQTIN